MSGPRWSDIEGVSQITEKPTLGLVDNEKIYPQCTRCNQKLAVFWNTFDKNLLKDVEPILIKVECCYCAAEGVKEYSAPVSVKLPFYSAGYFLPKHDDPDDAIPQTMIIDQYEMNGSNGEVFLVFKTHKA